MSDSSSSSSVAASLSSEELVDDLSSNELESWREVHGLLTKAVLVAREAVAAKKAQRRFWLEEICANLNEQGKLTTNSVWKRPAPPKKTVTKRTAKTQAADAPPPKKRRKKSIENAVAKQPKKPRKKKAKEDNASPASIGKNIHLKVPKSGSDAEKPSTLGGADAATSSAGGDDHGDHVPPQHGNSDTEDEDDSEVEDGDNDDGEEVDEYGYNPNKAREDHEAEFRRLQRMGAEYSHAAMMGPGSAHPYYLTYPGAAPPPMMPYYTHNAAADIQTGLHGQGVYPAQPPRRPGGSDDSSSEEEY